MTYEFTRMSDKQPLGNLANDTWHELRKLLPLMLGYINRSTQRDWSTVMALNITVTDQFSIPSGDQTLEPPPGGEFSIDDLLIEQEENPDEVFVTNPAELQRFFSWCVFLLENDGAFRLYEPCAAVIFRICR